MRPPVITRWDTKGWDCGLGIRVPALNIQGSGFNPQHHKGLDDTCLYSSTRHSGGRGRKVRNSRSPSLSRKHELHKFLFQKQKMGNRNNLCIPAILYNPSVLRTLSPFIKIIVSPIRAYIPTSYLVKVVYKPGMVAHTYNVSIQ